MTRNLKTAGTATTEKLDLEASQTLLAQADCRLLGDDHIPSARYTSKLFLDLEEKSLWPHTWQIACRSKKSQIAETTMSMRSTLNQFSLSGRKTAVSRHSLMPAGIDQLDLLRAVAA